MAKTEIVQARIDPEIKHQVEEVFSSIGVNTTEAIRIFFHQVIAFKGLPFDVRIPNQETIDALNEPRGNMKTFDTVEELFADLNAED
ncbi:MAG: type II toxin-antitoxin system RelB/DinJ family antitoxin [Gammaproteobacteria bacterium]|nr:type II toxin-antitoxin system RelB/DinJ family antitoxin [Gammaproteobacteria bacterium]